MRGVLWSRISPEIFADNRKRGFEFFARRVIQRANACRRRQKAFNRKAIDGQHLMAVENQVIEARIHGIAFRDGAIERVDKIAGANQPAFVVLDVLKAITGHQNMVRGRQSQFLLRHHRADRARAQNYRCKRGVGSDFLSRDRAFPDHAQRLQSITPGYDQIANAQIFNAAWPDGRAHVGACDKPHRQIAF